MVYRLSSIILFFLAGYSALVFNLYSKQVTQGQQYIAMAESQVSLSPDRGTIYFTDKFDNRVSAVSNKKLPEIYAVPSEIEDASEVAQALSPVLNIEVATLKKYFSAKSDYRLLKRKADKDTAAEVEELGLKGIYVRQSPERYYTFGEQAAHVLGFVAPNSTDAGVKGRYGVEELYDERLSGVPGEMRGNKVIAPKSGESLQLTIEPNVQIEASRILQKTVEKYKATGGTVIVQESKTGKILAMDSWPHFDPNSYGKSPVENFLNPAVQQIYEPGSVFKVITMAAALDAGKVKPDTTFNDTGVLLLNDKKIMNWDKEAHGTVTMTEVIELSLNTGAAFAERRLGDRPFREYVERFGFGNKTGVELPGELKGDLKPLNPKSPAIAFATASFGQGVAVTPIQMITSFSAIANGGLLMHPYINADTKPQSVRRVIKRENADKITKMMISAVDKAEVAKIKGYSMAGKTGTAQVPDFKRGGYTDKFINTYIGFGPASDPKFTILIKLNEPEGSPLAGQTVVPAFRELAQFMFNYYNVPPDRLAEDN
jgi:cell division protein FtsI/penicillin-binding protein 2